MTDDNDHEGCVDRWMERAASGKSPAQLVDLFEQAFGAMWGRAHVTLGEVTLSAILDRVLYRAAETHLSLATLRVEANGLYCGELRARVDELASDELAEGIRFVLVEFLTVLGSLTAEILTPALHAELASQLGTEREHGGGQAPGSKDREDPES